jgi:hypothetical protein
VDNQWGERALDRAYADIIGETDAPMPGVKLVEMAEHEYTTETVHERQTEMWNHLRACLVAVGLGEMPYGDVSFVSVKDSFRKDVPRFLNRLLGLPVADQVCDGVDFV